MTRFKCAECGEVFVYAAKKTVSLSSAFSEEYKEQYPMQFETHVCPFCQSPRFAEYAELQADAEAVYVHDLTTGPQETLNKMLAEGWKITYRTSKQYILEKCKVEEVKQK